MVETRLSKSAVTAFYAQSGSLSKTAAEFGVSAMSIRRRLKAWDVTVQSRGPAKLTAEQIADIRATHGETQTAIAARYGIRQNQVSRIRSGRRYD